MILFYNRQASTGIRAEPKDVIACMKDRGIDALKEQQIRSWWSTYHQKRKRSLNTLTSEGSTLQSATSIPTEQYTSVPTSTITPSTVGVTVKQTIQTSGLSVASSSIPSMCPVGVPVTQDTQTSGVTQCGIQSTNRASVPSMACQLTGASFPGLPDIVQWMFPQHFSQSTLGGRTGSNACTFIALYFGHINCRDSLPAPQGYLLLEQWKFALREAIMRGNDIHDELFEGEGCDVSVQDAVDMAGTECRVQSVGQNFDLIGFDCQNQLQDVFESLSAPPLLHPKFNAVVTIGRTMLFIVNADGSKPNFSS